MRQFGLKCNLVLLAGVFLFTVPLWAQNSGSIQGAVVDAKGAVIPGASVEATDQAKGSVVRETKAGTDGLFVLQPLGPGVYKVTVRAPGMRDLVRGDLNLDPYQKLGLGNMVMAVGGASQTVTVTSQQSLIQTDTSEHSMTIDSRQINEISQNGRDFETLMKTLPGIVSDNMSSFRLVFNETDDMHINGNKGSLNNFFLDGVVNTDVGANDGQYTQLSMDAVGEFQVLTNNFDAQYGRNPGVLVAVNTKSGTKQFHGTLWEFDRNTAFDANPYFNTHDASGNVLPMASQTSTPTLHFNQWGGNLGGPIPIPHYKNKLFFFFNYEGTHALKPTQGNLPTNHYYIVPNKGFLSGDFSSLLRNQPGNSQPLSYCTSASVSSCKTPLTIGGQQVYYGQLFQPGTITYDAFGNINGGVPYANNQIPTAAFSKNAKGFENMVSPLYQPECFSLANQNKPYEAQCPFQNIYSFQKAQLVTRIDFIASPKTNFFFRWVNDSQHEQQPTGIFSFLEQPILPMYRKKPGSSWEWNLVNVITPTLTNEAIFSYNHLTQEVAIQPSVAASSYSLNSLGFTFQQLYPNSNLSDRFPTIGPCCNEGSFGMSVFPPGWLSEARTYDWTDNVTKVSGPHTIMAGVFFDYNQAGQQPAWTDAPNFDFSGSSQNINSAGNEAEAGAGVEVANMLLGNYLNVKQTNGVFFGAFRYHQLELFGQDTWKVNHKLTLDYGLRWSYLGPTYTVKPFFENYFDPAAYNPAQAVSINTAPGLTQGSIIPGSGNPYNGMIEEGKGGIALGYAKHRYDNLGPRFGFAFDPFGDGKTALRGGGGIFYERVRQNANSFDMLGNPPLSYTPTIYNGNVDNLSPGVLGSGVQYPVGILGFSQAGQIPTYYDYSFEVQRALPGQMALDISYIGNQGRHEQYQQYLEELPLGSVLTQTLPAAAYAPYKGYTDINYTSYGGNSSYNGLQVSITRRFHRSLTLNANYTYSKAMDITDSDYGGSADTGEGSRVDYYWNPNYDRAVAGYDRTNVFNITYVYDLPSFHRNNKFLEYAANGWEVSGITTAESGPPLDLSINANAGVVSGPQVNRPNYDGGSIYASASHPGLQYFNPLVFSSPVAGTLGNVGRNFLRGPGFSNWDVSLFKNFKFGENMRLQLRLETFNTFNQIEWAMGPNSNGLSAPGIGQAVTAATAGTEGKLNNTRDPRAMQLAAKFYF
ncbi:MAG: carboxypeptidase regulatory-like domain-containing protein [Terriglobia bacterium]